MSGIIRPGAGILFMKVGTHAREPLEEIIARKKLEIEKAGVAFWGYGGNTCHPSTMVQPFAKSFEQRGDTIHLCMQPMESKHFAPQVHADEYSVDGIHWSEIDPNINAVGSRYALVIKNLRREEYELPLQATKVAVGNSLGAPGLTYISGRVDKACLEVTDELQEISEDLPRIKIGLVAEIAAPYAVFLRNRII